MVLNCQSFVALLKVTLYFAGDAGTLKVIIDLLFVFPSRSAVGVPERLLDSLLFSLSEGKITFFVASKRKSRTPHKVYTFSVSAQSSVLSM